MIKYVAFYTTQELKNEARLSNVAGVSVMDYMKEVYATADKVEILAPCRSMNKGGKYSAKNIELSDIVALKMPKTKGAKTPIGKFIENVRVKRWLYKELAKNTNKEDTVIAYHSPFIMQTVSKAKKKIGFTLIEEIREIYGDIWKGGEKLKKKEFEFFAKADKFIFATTELNSLINKNDKHYVIAPGVYKGEEIVANKFDDGKVHLVYAGNLNKKKGGAYVALEIAKYLTKDFTVHILGGGTKEQIEQFEKAVNEITDIQATIVYEGKKSGDEFISFLQSCDMGLSTQSIEGDFNGTSFPSKILTYMANGLKVLSSDISAVRNSPIGNYVYYYDGRDLEKSAQEICKIDFDKQISYQNILAQLDKDLKRDFNSLIKE